MFLLGDGKETQDWEPFAGRIYNNSPLISTIKVKLVSWGFNRKKENLTTSSPTLQINIQSKLVETSNEETFYNWNNFSIIFSSYYCYFIFIKI